jgi:hypothetical protein
MSSHHFVKDQQEPALLVLTDEIAATNILPGLLEWVPTVLVTQGNVHKIMSLGIKIDGIIADKEFQETNGILLEEQYPVIFITADEESFLDVGLKYLMQKKQKAVNILSFDPLTSDKLVPYLPALDIVFFNNGIRYFPAKNGKIKKWLPNCSMQVHGREGQFVEHHSASGSDIFSIKYATFLEIEEGMQTFSSNGLFWLGTFV